MFDSLLFSVLLSPLALGVYRLSYHAVVKYRLERYVIFAPWVILRGDRGVLVLNAERDGLEKRIDELRNTIIHADCMEVMPEMPESSVDAVITDPPYGIQDDEKVSKRKGSATGLKDSLDWERRKGKDQFKWLRRVLEEFRRILKPTGNLGLFYDRFEISRMRELGESVGFHALNYYALVKRNPAPRYRKDNFKSGFELAALFCMDKKESKFNYLNDDPQAMVNYHEYVPSDKETDHPTEKPVAPLKDLIKIFTDPGDLVFDPFCGSGSVLIAAQKTRRDWIGVEKNPKYVEMAEERLNANCRKLDEYRGREGNWDEPKDHEELPVPTNRKNRRLEEF
ncbi:hypothetical protein AKJ37_01670 [candidate division MSBL1 archaeon SCGC-AAA259I09]|uniref:Type II methyltransferase n=1 Tax=candidate division MSBL1 archaeon SCGC-AAA259I09 TaxID=1698267 RepID=A0A133UUY7_9EURY|nr:hypothetical protein AKJ37_01670 [candidate division MSBL1 archaeon SCGC-AAA259I09]